MSSFSSLGKYPVIAFLKNWLDVKHVRNLEVAFCNHEWRAFIMNCFKSGMLSYKGNNKPITEKALLWLLSRNIAVYRLILTDCIFRENIFNESSFLSLHLDCLSRIKKLEVIGCVSSPLAGLKITLPYMKSLDEVYFTDSGFDVYNDSLLSLIAEHCSQITSFTLHNASEITEYGLTNFCSKCYHIKYLDLGNPLITGHNRGAVNLTDKGMNAIANTLHSSLTSLCVSGRYTITSKCIKTVSTKCQFLTELDISECQSIDVNAFNHLVKHTPQLTALNSGTCQLIKMKLPDLKLLLSRLRKFESTDYWGFRSNDELRDIFSDCRLLEHVTLSRIASDKLIGIISKNNENLSYLDITGSLNANCATQLTDITLMNLKSNCGNKLRQFRYDDTRFSDEYICYLTKGCVEMTYINLSIPFAHSMEHIVLPKCSHVIEIDFKNNVKINDSVCIAVGRHCKQLTKITAFCCKNVTDVGIEYLTNCCPKLTYIKLSSNVISAVIITSASLLNIAQYCHYIEHIHLVCKFTLSDTEMEIFTSSCTYLQSFVLENTLRTSLTESQVDSLALNCKFLKQITQYNVTSVVDNYTTAKYPWLKFE